jgi:hypothetical protein
MRYPSLATAEVLLRLPSSQSSVVPEGRLLVDLESARSPYSEREVALVLHRDRVHRGSFVIEPSASLLLYRLGICAPRGTLWKLRIRDAYERDVLNDADTVDTQKSWLVGTCPLTAACTAGEVVSLERYRARRTGDRSA